MLKIYWPWVNLCCFGIGIGSVYADVYWSSGLRMYLNTGHSRWTIGPFWARRWR